MNESNEHVNSESLCLQRDEKNEICVNNSQILEQHQLDGLRFLFKQFKKKQPGVIVNFPEGCGKSVTVALFLHTVQNILKLPTLILCKEESDVFNWKKHLARWTEINEDDIVIDAKNPLIRKKVFIKKCPVELNSYLRRSWGIVVVKEDVINKDILKLVFTADYKIWITSQDIMKDLSFLSYVYTWLNPKSKIDINDFRPKNEHPKEIYQKSVLLETFLEDVVIQRNVNLRPFHTKEIISKPEIEVEVDKSKSVKRSIKNKDATGTKIKRSKIRIDSDIDTNNQTTSVSNNDIKKGNESTISNNKEGQIANVKDEINIKFENYDRDTSGDNNSPKLDVESFIREQQPLQPKQDIDCQLNNKDEATATSEATESLDFTTAINELIEIENMETEHSTKSFDFDVDFKIETMKFALETNSQSLATENKIKPDEININHGLKSTTESFDVYEDFAIKSNENEFSNEIHSAVVENVNNDNKRAQTFANTSLQDAIKSSETGFINEKDAKGIENINNENKTAQTTSVLEDNNETNDDLNTRNDMETKMAEDTDNKETGKFDEGHKDIDSKISELEEQAFKKFKGSLLDRIF